MGVLTGIDEAKKQLSTAQTAFVGRLVSAKIIRSTRSIPPRNYYIIEFEENIKSLNGSVPTTTQFDYSQKGKGEKILIPFSSAEDPPEPKEPQSGHFYVAICNSEANKIDTLIEINENDIPTL
jgi:hypothetical protein